MKIHPTVTSILLHRRSSALVIVGAAVLLAGPACGSGGDYATDHATDHALDAELRRGVEPVGVAAASLGLDVACVTTLPGDAKCWGHNHRGQLGRGDLVDIGDDETPEAEPFIELGGEAQQVATNGAQTFALLQDGTVRAWGDNTDYALGLLHTERLGDDETPLTAEVATDVQLGAGAVELAVGSDFACARLSAGTVRCWGQGDQGQLGRASTERIGDDETPASGLAISLGAPVVDIAAGAHHACAVVSGGSVYCWGQGAHGQLGYGSTEAVGDDEWPVSAGSVVLSGPAVEVVAGGQHTCALLATGEVQCWGANDKGQLGYGHTEAVGDDEEPAAVGPVPVGGEVVSLAAGWDHTWAVLDTGGVRCWGANDQGQLGYGHTESVGDDEEPAAVGDVDLGGAGAVAVFGGPLTRSTCVALDAGAVRCWGANDQGQLGYGHTEAVGDELEERPGDLPDIILLDIDDEA